MALTIDEKIKLLKDTVRLVFPSHHDVLIDIEETVAEEDNDPEDAAPAPGGFCLRIVDCDDAPIVDDFRGDGVEKIIDNALKAVGKLADETVKRAEDVAKRLEMYRHPVEVALPEKEGKKR